MEVQLQELVERIRKDGVDGAEAKAKEIIDAAERQAASLIETAKAEASEIVKKAGEDAARSEKAAVSAISQAGRNLLLSFRDGVGRELAAIVSRETANAYDSDVLRELLPSVVKAWIAAGSGDDISAILSPSDATKLEGYMTSALKGEISKGFVIGSDASIAGGFRIGTKDGAAYYDFSAEAVAELFSSYLNPRVSAILKAAAKEL
jgi:V/A-type H+/Na+-transporting ATPase subunit E